LTSVWPVKAATEIGTFERFRALLRRDDDLRVVTAVRGRSGFRRSGRRASAGAVSAATGEVVPPPTAQNKDRRPVPPR
jgi:hypothetical protein